MPVERGFRERPFYIDQVPPWPCPRCGVGRLELRGPDWIRIMPGAETRAHAQDEDFPPEHETGAVCCLVECNRQDCGEACSVSGYWYKEMRYFEGEPSPVSICRPTMITPPPPMIRIPPNCPEVVSTEIRAGFGAFWSDKAACLNHLRQSMELMLTTMRVPKSQKNKAKKLVRLSLHQRIERLKADRPKLADLCEKLMAVKDMGNAGSHSGLIHVPGEGV